MKMALSMDDWIKEAKKNPELVVRQLFAKFEAEIARLKEVKTCATCRHFLLPSSKLGTCCHHPRMAAYIIGDLDPKDNFGCILWEGADAS